MLVPTQEFGNEKPKMATRRVVANIPTDTKFRPFSAAIFDDSGRHYWNERQSPSIR